MAKSKAPKIGPTPIIAREIFQPEWTKAREGTGAVQLGTYMVRQLIESAQAGKYRIPAFQRPYVWSDQQIVSLLESLRDGDHIGNLLLWSQYQVPASREKLGHAEIHCDWKHETYFVLDGQQRLGAIMSAVMTDRFGIRLSTGEIQVDQMGADWLPMRLALVGTFSEAHSWCRQQAERYGVDHNILMDSWCYTRSVFDNCQMAYVILPSCWGLERVRNAFRLHNSTGTPMDPQMLAEALQRAM